MDIATPVALKKNVYKNVCNLYKVIPTMATKGHLCFLQIYVSYRLMLISI
jgi:hypothetical protein